MSSIVDSLSLRRDRADRRHRARGPDPRRGRHVRYLGYSEGCTAAITAGLIPRPVDDLMTPYYNAADPRWIVIRADQEEPPGF